ncbi:flagellar basal body rod protein FlgB [Paraclostridium sordellii]|uniref:flagellar basal body rod protein FlgB n=1 Tax=Paraclostridium sordellii TaxID=1505 RepID=UPI0003861D1C|nr:flagellar basal body rod protein FlgB [Paeniclostridium sordellii]EPZ59839.1 flagellar basal-body rod protein FlgB [[Clostridium] sordellii VPI 9048] [Paeniclostridium sordellii VPI 9048]CEK39029.1 Flagellar basal-body rod protein FlgB [[Clostridium] sordellii] [Paeniclostridium sordellii]
MEIYNLMKAGLDATALRSKVIANNIANVNTPNYKRKYVSFEDTLNESVNGKPKIEVKTDENSKMRVDGNNIDLESEKVNQAATTLEFNALVTLTNIKLGMAKNVIAGR